MRFRGKSIRRKIVALLLVPLIALTGIWGFATALTWREADQLLGVGYIVEKVGYPVEDVVRVIQDERRQTLVYLADPRASDALPDLRRQRAATDEMVAKIRANAQDRGVQDEMSAASESRLASVLDAFDDIGALRRTVEEGPISARQALNSYSDLIDPCYGFLMTLHGLNDVELDKQGRALVGLARSRELLAREDALISAALVADRVDRAQLRQFADLVAQRKLRTEISNEVLPTAERARFERYWQSPAATHLLELEKTLLDASPGKPRGLTAESWERASTKVLDELAELNTAAGDRYQDRVRPEAVGVLVRAGAAGVLGLIALLLSLFLSVRIGRGLIRDLTRLRKDAHEVSGVRLPSVMRRLAAGEQVDVETEAPRLEYDKDEMGQVGQALNTLQRAAVEAAVKQADMRRGVSEVFVNLARRSQVLLHKQLTLLDSMERRTEDTEELADLFRLDHLTTRMRRHAEGLVILSGAAPSRQWRKPVKLMDVVRAAVAEVEDYERIEVRRLARIAVTGPAVADITHLTAELLENATVFSPPHTAVQVHGERVANGFTLEIHDRGLGMTPDALLEANLRLAETPEFELSDTDRLGLFVVSRLAQRQNVRVSLQPSPYGGTTAVVFIPDALLTEPMDADTNGAGIRIEPGRGLARREGSGDIPARLAEVPVQLPGLPPSVLDGPIELEGPVGPNGLGLGLGTPRTRETDDAGERRGSGGPDDLVGLGGIADLTDISEAGGAGATRNTRHPRDSRDSRDSRDTRAPKAPRDPRDTRDPRDPRDLRDNGDIGDEDSERGGLFRPRRRTAPGGRGEHQQARDGRDGSGGSVRPGPEPAAGGPVPLPRRRTPKLVSSHGRPVGRNGPGPHDTTTRTSERPAPAEDTAPAPDSGAPATRDAEPARSEAPPGALPRRVRQASLAPQLRDEREAEPAREEPRPERDADEVRSRMASLQRGWQRGRRENGEEVPGLSIDDIDDEGTPAVSATTEESGLSATTEEATTEEATTEEATVEAEATAEAEVPTEEATAEQSEPSSPATAQPSTTPEGDGR